MITLPFKLTDKNNNALYQSVGIHLLVGLVFLSFVLFNSKPTAEKLSIKIIEVEPSQVPKAVNLNQPKNPVKEIQKAPPPVFGLSKDSLISESGSVAVKAGNTIAKEVDAIKIDPNAADTLPIPTDEFLITQMPKIKREIRADYPSAAKEANYQGSVLTELLIDAAGKVRNVEVIEGAPYGLTESAVNALFQFEFAPAQIKNEKVAVKIRYRYRFELNQ